MSIMRGSPMKALRTPDSQFENLPDYDFKPNYVTLSDGLS